jgi:hypothetical protein
MTDTPKYTFKGVEEGWEVDIYADDLVEAIRVFRRHHRKKWEGKWIIDERYTEIES